MLRRTASVMVKAAAAAADGIRHPRPGLVVLLYHRVDAGTGASIDLDRGSFDEQMAVLAEGFTPVTLDDGLARLTGDARVASDRPPVVVTFDDGTADFADHALPILAAHRVPATVYVVTGLVGSDRPFSDGVPMLSWAALADAASTGLVTVGSHTHNHRLLDDAEAALAVDELDRSIAAIGDRLGSAPRHFAYPKAQAGSAAADTAVRQRFASAALAGTRANRFGATDPYRLARSPIQVADGMRWFERKARGGMELEDRLRRRLDARRYADVTT